MGEQSAEYFRKREREERAAAASASSPIVRGIHVELAERYAQEAEQCRRQAQGYQARPEQQFLLQVASSFHELAETAISEPSRRSITWWR
jgi:hypothetical protein